MVYSCVSDFQTSGYSLSASILRDIGQSGREEDKSVLARCWWTCVLVYVLRGLECSQAVGAREGGRGAESTWHTCMSGISSAKW